MTQTPTVPEGGAVSYVAADCATAHRLATRSDDKPVEAVWREAIEAAARAVERQIPDAAGGPMSHTNTARVFMFDAVKAIRALATRKPVGTIAHVSHGRSELPELIASALRAQPQAREVAYQDAHDIAVELGYPSLTEALEDLDRLKQAPDALRVAELEGALRYAVDLLPGLAGADGKPDNTVYTVMATKGEILKARKAVAALQMEASS